MIVSDIMLVVVLPKVTFLLVVCLVDMPSLSAKRQFSSVSV